MLLSSSVVRRSVRKFWTLYIFYLIKVSLNLRFAVSFIDIYVHNNDTHVKKLFNQIECTHCPEFSTTFANIFSGTTPTNVVQGKLLCQLTVTIVRT